MFGCNRDIVRFSLAKFLCYSVNCMELVGVHDASVVLGGMARVRSVDVLFLSL